MSQNLDDDSALGHAWNDVSETIDTASFVRERDSLLSMLAYLQNKKTEGKTATLRKWVTLEEDSIRVEQINAWLQGRADKVKYGHPNRLKSSVSPAMRKDIPFSAQFNLPLAQGKYALVAFHFDRQVKPDTHVDSTNMRYGVRNNQEDSSKFWAPWNAVAPLLYQQFLAKNLLSTIQVMPQEEVFSNSTYKSEGVYVPQVFLGIQAPFDYVMAPGFSYYNPMLTKKLAAVAQALAVDYVISFEYTASYAVFNRRDFAEGQPSLRDLAQLRLELYLVIHDKNGKFVQERHYAALSPTKTVLYNDEIYPAAVPFLVEEAHNIVLEQVAKSIAGGY